MNLRQLVTTVLPEAQASLGRAPGVFEVHVNPDDPSEINGFGPSTLKDFLKDWGRTDYMGEFSLPCSAWRQQFIGVVHPDGALLVKLEGQ